jgi:hypothetical protein
LRGRSCKLRDISEWRRSHEETTDDR